LPSRWGHRSTREPGRPPNCVGAAS
jgi:hypothetical protein